MMWTQSSGFCEGIVKSVSTSTSTDQETKNSGTVSSQETLSGEAAESTLSREHFLIKKKAVSTFFFIYILCFALARSHVGSLNHSFTLRPPNHPQMPNSCGDPNVCSRLLFLDGVRSI